jgi:hypothetical protein
MDKAISFRASERTADTISALAHRLNTTKKDVIVRAVAFYEAKLRDDEGLLILEKSSGAWKRNESPAKTVQRIRRAFQRSWDRHREGPC